MQAFFNDQKIKERFLSRIHEHAKADEIVKGKYWEGGKGCAVGCTIHDSDHAQYEKQLGIPEWLARVEDTFFEHLPNENAKIWPASFLKAINLGADLEKIKAPFMIYILQQALGNFDHEKYPQVKMAIDDVVLLWKKYPKGPSAAWSAAEAAA